MNAAVLRFIPRVGHRWPHAGGRYVGLCGSELLIYGVKYEQPLIWQMATLWTQELRHEGFADWRLPSIGELELIRNSLPGRLGIARYWSCETVTASDAMTLDFETGFAMHWAIHFPLHAVAVRRHTL
jgi:hypothetical protein